jgi:iron complex outermembrane recepter protein
VHNPSDVKQLFAKTGYQDEKNDVDLSFTWADNTLEGNQTLPTAFLNTPRDVYTFPDIQENKLAFLNLKGSHYLNDKLLVAGDVYYRHVRTTVFNSNFSNDFNPAQAIDIVANPPAQNIYNTIDEARPGASLQLTDTHDVWGRKNNATVGASLDRGRTDFEQSNQSALIAADRSTFSSEPIVIGTRLRGTTTYAGLYATDTLSLAERLHLTLSGRYNDAKVKLDDRLGTALNGDHAFHRFNPAAGLAFNPVKSSTVYGSYSEGMRAPTPVELSCADPNAPCSLPNAFSADPALKPVVSKTFETGARGRIADTYGWSVALFRTTLNDDIQFISSGGGATSAGYFQNVGQTRRQGLELGFDAAYERLSLSAHYTFLEATYQTPLILNSPSNSSAQAITCPTCSDIRVSPGNHIPNIPQHSLKLRADYRPMEKVSVGLSVIGQGRAYVRGDENNQDIHGALPSYAVVNLDARYQPAKRWTIFAKVNNLFDKRCYTFGQLGQNVFTLPNRAFDPTGATWANDQFRTVGAPIGAWLGVSYAFGESGPKGRD